MRERTYGTPGRRHPPVRAGTSTYAPHFPPIRAEGDRVAIRGLTRRKPLYPAHVRYMLSGTGALPYRRVRHPIRFRPKPVGGRPGPVAKPTTWAVSSSGQRHRQPRIRQTDRRPRSVQSRAGRQSRGLLCVFLPLRVATPHTEITIGEVLDFRSWPEPEIPSFGYGVICVLFRVRIYCRLGIHSKLPFAAMAWGGSAM